MVTTKDIIMHTALRRIVDVTVVLMLIGAVVVIVIELTKGDDEPTKKPTSTPKATPDPLPDKDPDGNDVPTFEEIVAGLDGPDEPDTTWLKWTGVGALILIVILALYFFALPKWRAHRERVSEIENTRGMTDGEKRVAKQASYMKAAKSSGSQKFIEAAIREAFDIGKDAKRKEEAHAEIDRLFKINSLKTAAAMALAMDKEAVAKAEKIADVVNEKKRGKQIKKFLEKHGVMGDTIMRKTLYERSLREP